MNQSFGFEELEVWKKSRLLKIEITELIKQFSTEEKYNLTNQLIRSSRSILALISGGHGRFSYPIKFIFVFKLEVHYQKP